MTASSARVRHAQRSFDDLGKPLQDTTFCVIDLETTGGSPAECAITEIGAVKVQGGVAVGTFQTLVNPGRAIPPTITVLTGITDVMVVRSPRIEAVLPSLLEFIADSVIVGHNVRFDMSFLQAALRRDEREPLPNPTIDTLALARRLVRDEVPNCKLDTLATRFRLDHRPTHRALDDALTTADLLHVLLERAGGLGVSGLDDLRELPTLAGSAHVAKLRLTDRLPRTPGVYLFRDRRGQVLYVGKATNLRARVRQYFSTDDRRMIGGLLRETERIDHKTCTTELEASVLESRLIHHLEPRFNRHGTRSAAAVYIRFALGQPFPRLTVVHRRHDDGSLFLGPISSTRVARTVIDAVHSVVPLRRCGASPSSRKGPCLGAQLGVSLCPCAGPPDAVAYAEAVRSAFEGLTANPSALVEPLWARMEHLAATDRFEEAAVARDRVAALVDTLARQRRLDALRRVRLLVVGCGNGSAVEFRRGRLTRVREPEVAGGLPFDGGWRTVEAAPEDPGPPENGPLAPALAAELLVVSRWLDRHGPSRRIELVSGEWSSPRGWIAGRASMLAATRR